MCGIFGLVAREAPDGSLLAAADRMRRALDHRGPDGWGLAILEGHVADERRADGPPLRRSRVAGTASAAAIGHQRLAVIDLSDGGRQPRASGDRRFWIAYNGEIYNYRELGEELASTGVRLESASDTEVLLHLFVRDGERCLDRLRGMFAFAVWDDVEGVLFMARDRFGMKPLCYTQAASGALAFASEPKALLRSGLASREPAPGAAVTFLRRGAMPAGASWYRDIRVVPPGHWVRWDGSTLSGGAYWRVGQSAEPVPVLPAAHAAAAVRPALVASVAAHLVGDVPVGIFLSGGLDSTAVLAAARDAHPGPLRSFTVTVPGTALDESRLARQAAATFGTDHSEVEASADRFFGDLERFFDAMDEPSVDGPNTFLIARAAREAGLKVVLSGLGADELLGGYDSFIEVPRIQRALARLGRLPGARRGASWLAGQLPTPAAPKMAELLGTTTPNRVAVWRAYRALFSRAHLHAILGPLAAADDPAGRADTHDAFWDVARCEIDGFMGPQLLRDGDAFTMAWGLELRTPFVDHHLLERVRDTIRWTRSPKATYKATLFAHMRGLVPESHLGQPKRGFVLPVDAWLREAVEDRTRRDESLDAVLTDRRCRFAVELFRRGRLHWSRLWALYVLERFTRRDGTRPLG